MSLVCASAARVLPGRPEPPPGVHLHLRQRAHRLGHGVSRVLQFLCDVPVQGGHLAVQPVARTTFVIGALAALGARLLCCIEVSPDKYEDFGAPA